MLIPTRTLPRPYVNDPIQAQPWKKEFNIAHKDIVLGNNFSCTCNLLASKITTL